MMNQNKTTESYFYSEILQVAVMLLAFMALMVLALDQWAKQDPTPYCNGDICAATADTLRVMEQEGY